MRDIEIYIDRQKADFDVLQDSIKITDLPDDTDTGDIQMKRVTGALDLTLPSTQANDKIFSSIALPESESMLADESLAGIHDAVIKAGGDEVVVGKAQVVAATSINGKPSAYSVNVHGGNGDWTIPLQNAPLIDYVSSTPILMSDDTVLDSLNFDGRDESKDYVFAPVKYSWDFVNENGDPMVTIKQLRPHISIYWILYRMFKSQGYKIVSDFMDSDYFRRLVLLWTWGNFFGLDDKKFDAIKFSAETAANTDGTDQYVGYTDTGVYVADLKVTNSSTDGNYNNNGVYTYNAATKRMQWKYPTSISLGTLNVEFNVNINAKWRFGNFESAYLYVKMYKNSTLYSSKEVFHRKRGLRFLSFGGDQNNFGLPINTVVPVENVSPGDLIECEVTLELDKGALSGSDPYFGLNMGEFSINSLYVPLNTYKSINQYDKLNNYLVLDLLRGVIDMFDLEVKTDPIARCVYIEPSQKFYEQGSLDWTDKQDLSKESEMSLYADVERNYQFQFKDDSADGGLKAVQDRNTTVIGKSAYIFPQRFKQADKTYENRFFSPLMHIELDQFTSITGITPQFPCVIANDIASASSLFADNTFAPKIAYYKGITSGVGGWKYQRQDGPINQYTTLPFIFAVNYKNGGQNDPVLSYADQLIQGQVVPGLMRTFFLTRLSIMRYGRKYKTYMHINNTDMSNWLHRESIVINNTAFRYIGVDSWDAASDESCALSLWKIMPKTQTDIDNIRPTSDCILQSQISAKELDFLYWPHKVLPSDAIIPSN